MPTFATPASRRFVGRRFCFCHRHFLSLLLSTFLPVSRPEAAPRNPKSASDVRGFSGIIARAMRDLPLVSLVAKLSPPLSPPPALPFPDKFAPETTSLRKETFNDCEMQSSSRARTREDFSSRANLIGRSFDDVRHFDVSSLALANQELRNDRSRDILPLRTCE